MKHHCKIYAPFRSPSTSHRFLFFSFNLLSRRLESFRKSKHICHLRQRIYRLNGCVILRFNLSDNIFISQNVIRLWVALLLPGKCVFSLLSALLVMLSALLYLHIMLTWDNVQEGMLPRDRWYDCSSIYSKHWVISPVLSTEYITAYIAKAYSASRCRQTGTNRFRLVSRNSDRTLLMNEYGDLVSVMESVSELRYIDSLALIIEYRQCFINWNTLVIYFVGDVDIYFYSDSVLTIDIDTMNSLFS